MGILSSLFGVKGPEYHKIIAGVAATPGGRGYIQAGWDGFAQYLHRNGSITHATDTVVAAAVLLDGRRHVIALERDPSNKDRCILSVEIEDGRSPKTIFERYIKTRGDAEYVCWTLCDNAPIQYAIAADVRGERKLASDSHIQVSKTVSEFLADWTKSDGSVPDAYAANSNYMYINQLAEKMTEDMKDPDLVLNWYYDMAEKIAKRHKS